MALGGGYTGFLGLSLAQTTSNGRAHKRVPYGLLLGAQQHSVIASELQIGRENAFVSVFGMRNVRMPGDDCEMGLSQADN